MTEKARRDFCIECRKETEYLLQKKDIVKNIRNKEYTFAITVAVCAECGEEMSMPGAGSDWRGEGFCGYAGTVKGGKSRYPGLYD